MPARVSVPQVQADGPERRMPVTGYTLAASWSPEYCKGRERQTNAAMQCAGGNGRFGFVLHGLWPEGRGSWPQWCSTPRQPSPAELRANLCMSPSARLIARQWAKHGSCMVRKPETYLRVSRILWNSLTFPDMDRLSREDGLTVGRLRDEFLRGNPGWPRAAIGVEINRRGWLEELRLCYDRRFRPARCDNGKQGARDNARLKVWRGL